MYTLNLGQIKAAESKATTTLRYGS